jgi:hypothetical protein
MSTASSKVNGPPRARRHDDADANGAPRVSFDNDALAILKEHESVEYAGTVPDELQS